MALGAFIGGIGGLRNLFNRFTVKFSQNNYFTVP
jgi:hypothetical protein